MNDLAEKQLKYKRTLLNREKRICRVCLAVFSPIILGLVLSVVGIPVAMILAICLAPMIPRCRSKWVENKMNEYKLEVGVNYYKH